MAGSDPFNMVFPGDDAGYVGSHAIVRSSGPYWGYGGWVPRSVIERRDALVPHFPQLDWSYVEFLAEQYSVTGETKSGRKPIHSDADGGLIVFPKLEAVGKCVRSPRSGWEPLNIALEYILNILKETDPNFMDSTHGKVGPDYECLLKATASHLAKIDAETPGDVLVLPFQAGAQFKGYTMRSAINRMRELNYHVPAHDFAGLCLMLSDPERFAEHTLFADCPGSQRAPFAGVRFCEGSSVCFHFGCRQFCSYGVDSRCLFESSGSCSFVVPP